jgi:hypothetical protein
MKGSPFGQEKGEIGHIYQNLHDLRDEQDRFLAFQRIAHLFFPTTHTTHPQRTGRGGTISCEVIQMAFKMHFLGEKMGGGRKKMGFSGRNQATSQYQGVQGVFDKQPLKVFRFRIFKISVSVPILQFPNQPI